MLQERQPDVGLAEAYHVSHKHAPELFQDGPRPLVGGLLEVGQNGPAFVQNLNRLCLDLQLAAKQVVQRLDVDVVGSDFRVRRPGLPYLAEQGLVEVLRLIPQLIEPRRQPRVVVVAMHYDVQLSGALDSRDTEVRGADNGHAPVSALRVALVEDVAFRMKTALGVDLDLQPALLNEPRQRDHELLGLVGLVLKLKGLAHVAAGQSQALSLGVASGMDNPAMPVLGKLQSLMR